MTHLFLDDERFPGDVTWVALPRVKWTIVRTPEEFRDHIIEHGIPHHISFDNDLGDGLAEGRDCARWMVERVLDGDLTIPDDFTFTVHSKNNVAAEAITLFLNQFLDVHSR